MQAAMCSRCGKNVAVIFVTKSENGIQKNEGYCLKCARELHLPAIDDMMNRFGISDDDIEQATEAMAGAFGGLEQLMPQDAEDDGDADSEGKAPTFPFFKMFMNGGAGSDPNDHGKTPETDGQSGRSNAQTNQRKGKRRFLDQYCIDLTNRAREGKLDRMIGRHEELERVIQILNRRQKNNPCLIGEPRCRSFSDILYRQRRSSAYLSLYAGLRRREPFLLLRHIRRLF